MTNETDIKNLIFITDQDAHFIFNRDKVDHVWVAPEKGKDEYILYIKIQGMEQPLSFKNDTLLTKVQLKLLFDFLRGDNLTDEHGIMEILENKFRVPEQREKTTDGLAKIIPFKRK